MTQLVLRKIRSNAVIPCWEAAVSMHVSTACHRIVADVWTRGKVPTVCLPKWWCCLLRLNTLKLSSVYCFSRATVLATRTVFLCCWSDHGCGERWRCLRLPQPSTSLTTMESTRPWGRTLLPSASSKRGPDGSTLPTPTKKSVKSKPVLGTSAPMWDSGSHFLWFIELIAL